MEVEGTFVRFVGQLGIRASRNNDICERPLRLIESSGADSLPADLSFSRLQVNKLPIRTFFCPFLESSFSLSLECARSPAMSGTICLSKLTFRRLS